MFTADALEFTYFRIRRILFNRLSVGFHSRKFASEKAVADIDAVLVCIAHSSLGLD